MKDAVWYAVVLGGGAGTRMGLGRNKVLVDLCGIPVIRRSVAAFEGLAAGAAVVCPPLERPLFERALEGVAMPLLWADGGETRQDSVRAGLDVLPEACTHVLVHDGARCLVDTEVIRAAQESALRHGSGVAAVPVTDTVKRADAENRVTETLSRDDLRAMQTPQAFALPLLLAAHRKAREDGFLGTDDAALVERLGEPVHLSAGSRRNLKLTTPEDMAMAEAMLREETRFPSVRVGTGYDVHRLTEGRKLILCGTEIPYRLGLDGHSDADVAVHALMDAMLGAAALGDIGQHFPDRDETYRGIDSMILLDRVTAILEAHRLRTANCDITIVAQAPKLAPYVPQMRAHIAEALRLPTDRVSVKATTTERLGFEGRGEGISAQACVLLQEI